jgi:hypothetical protein
VYLLHRVAYIHGVLYKDPHPGASVQSKGEVTVGILVELSFIAPGKQFTDPAMTRSCSNISWEGDIGELGQLLV